MNQLAELERVGLSQLGLDQVDGLGWMGHASNGRKHKRRQKLTDSGMVKGRWVLNELTYSSPNKSNVGELGVVVGWD